MPRGRAMQGVLNNFLSTYTSRYSTFDGYWLFGFIVNDLERVEFDLLSPPTPDKYDALEAASLFASNKFIEQICKSGLSISCVVNAFVVLSKSAAMSSSLVENSYRSGFDVTFEARAYMEHGKYYECSDTIFVAPHDPKLERRNAKSPNYSTS